MPAALDVDTIMANGLGHWLEERRGDRVWIRRKYRAVTAGSILAAILLFAATVYLGVHPETIGQTELPGFMAMIGLFGSGFLAVGGLIAGYMIKSNAIAAIKREANGAIASAMGIHYSPTGKPGEMIDFARTFQILPGYANRTSEDFWSGYFGDAGFHIFETTLTSGTGRHTTVNFKGILMHLKTRHAYRGATVIRRSSRWQRWRNTPIVAGPLTLEPVAIADPEFSRNFMVYSTDPDIARAIVSPSHCHTLLALEKRFTSKWHGFLHGSGMNVLFYEQALVIAMRAKNLFESAGFSASQDRERIERTILQFRGVLDLLENIDRHDTKLSGD
ncbi:DUF3137 domain-containing protein [Parasphingopyxis marina]|uniref:DUF3137 domain-containing protein n=1 Tax=Parasphingopyxis marina TaxID=2761622 RepID=A0A842I1D4_9SPHN|nr:DUF3137 domain-containing protein [Parasphingopyxis marina]MBC2778513.1 DUF3137 domain-containing protein [Parasphingopyxis marina]